MKLSPKFWNAVAPVLMVAACSPAPEPGGGAGESVPVAPVSLADYQRAEQFLTQNTRDLIDNTILAHYWQTDDRLIYRRSTESGIDYILANPFSGEKSAPFDSDSLATALSALVEEDLSPQDLMLSDIELDSENTLLKFSYAGEHYSVNLDDYTINLLSRELSNEFLSPDGRRAVFIQDHNLWVRDTESSEVTQLTFDGELNYGYGTNNAGWIRRDTPVLKWSTDSNSVATFRHDGRNVGEMYLYSTQVGHGELDAWKYPLPGDEHIFMIERVVIHFEPEPRLVRLKMPPDPHRSTTADHIASFSGEFLDVEWSDDGQLLAFVSSSRDHKVAQLRLADPFNGEVTEVHREEVETYYESGSRSANWRVLPSRNEFIWFSEQSDWGHLYLHDLESGALKRQITTGNWLVLEIEQLNLDSEQIFFRGSNREAGDPYYHYLYRVGFDGSGLTNLTPEAAHHVISFSDSGDYFMDSASTPTDPGGVVIRNRDGDLVMELESPEISRLRANGWVPPEPFTVKARDQITDLYGLMYRPSNFDSNHNYPVLNYLYPGPQTGSVGSRSFRASRGDKQALAELGFVVVEVDAMGTPGRSKSFHDAYYGNMGDNGLPDQIAMIRQLAERFPAMDLDRVGIWGHSGGGFASTAGILRYPEFYKVAVSGAGNHDNRNYEDDWGEKWQGLLEVYPEDNPADHLTGGPATNYDNQANQLLAENLRGKLLLAHGMMDSNVHPSNTLLLVDALINADKDFDLVILPNAGHGFGNRRYFMKRRWDYFVENLLGAEAPEEFAFADNIP